MAEQPRNKMTLEEIKKRFCLYKDDYYIGYTAHINNSKKQRIDDTAWLIQRVEELETENAKLREALKPLIQLVKDQDKKMLFYRGVGNCPTEAVLNRLDNKEIILRKASEALNG